MAIQVADNFQYLGQKPLDARVKYATVADMAAVAASSLYDGIMAYVVATEKNYQWKSTNPVDQTLGKWREFQSGGGDVTGRAKSTAIAPVFDDTETYAAGDRVTYEDELYVFNTAHTGAWDAADADKSDVDSEIPDKLTSQQMQEIKDAFSGMNKGAPLRMMHYSTEEQVVGTWIDGKPIYQKTFTGSSYVSSDNDISFDISALSIDSVVDVTGCLTSTTYAQTLSISHPDRPTFTQDNITWYVNGANKSEFVIKGGNWKDSTYHFTVQYTKTTDTPQ